MQNISEQGGRVMVDGIEIDGFIAPEKFCPKCGSTAIYAEKYDSYLCPKCNQWLEEGVCTDPTCEFCPNRPLRPINF